MSYLGSIERLAPSRSKAEFLERLGLREDIPEHRDLYERMKVCGPGSYTEIQCPAQVVHSPSQAEAVAGRQRTSEDVTNLVPQSRDDPNVHPPYASNQISETAMFREIHRIYESASPWTRPIYDRGWYADGPNRDNWIIRWCLWHVFRYRDNRNKQRWRKPSARSSEPNSPTGNRSRSRRSPNAGPAQDPTDSTGSNS